MTRVVVFNAEPLGYSAAARETWRNVGEYHEGSIDDAANADVLARATVLIVRLAQRIDARVLDRCPRLKTIVSATTGLDHLDMEALRSRAIELLSLRGETDFLGTITSTPEHAFALMLALVRNVVPAAESVRRGEWDRDRFRGRELQGRGLGLVGLGRTGQMMAIYAAAFGMRVSYFDPFVRDSAYCRCDTLEELLRGSEIVSLHVHLDSSTAKMIGAKELSHMPPGGRLINTSRGGLIDEQALAAAIRSGHVAGCAVDVLDGELDSIEASPLWQLMREGGNVLITPHVGGATVDAMHACEEYVAGKVAQTVRAPVA